jgi:hypothetical protein
MKITKELVKEIIQEELEAQLEEQVSSFVAAGEEAARRRAKSVQGPSAIEKFISEPGGLETATDMVSTAAAELDKVKGKDTSKKRKGIAFKPEAQTMQAMLNVTLKAIGSKLPPLELDGKAGRKTRAAAREVRKNLKRGESIMAGMQRLAGMDSKQLKRTAARMIIDTDPEVQTAMATLDKATAGMTATPAGPLKESFKRFLK